MCDEYIICIVFVVGGCWCMCGGYCVFLGGWVGGGYNVCVGVVGW